MKQILPILLLFVFGTSVQAQDYQVSPDDNMLDTMIMELSNDAFVSGKIKTNIFNNTASESSLRWEIVSIDAPAEWRPQLCVNDESGGCFAWDVLFNVDIDDPSGINVPLVIAPNDNSIFELAVRPSSVAACGTYEIRVTTTDDLNTEVAKGTFTFRFNVDANCEAITTSTENFNKASIKIFPNPTVDFFTITDNPFVREIQIFNIIGKQMSTVAFQNGNAINVSNFPNGLYLVRMLDKDGDVLKTTRLTKR
ncbi:MAG: T9SS type A sorting domain-containing protein [Bacteroidota bacterium]